MGELKRYTLSCGEGMGERGRDKRETINNKIRSGSHWDQRDPGPFHKEKEEEEEKGEERKRHYILDNPKRSPTLPKESSLGSNAWSSPHPHAMQRALYTGCSCSWPWE